MTASHSWRYRWAVRKVERAVSRVYRQSQIAQFSADRDVAAIEAKLLERALNILKERAT